MAHSPLGKRGSKFWYIVIWKDLETVFAAFDRLQDNVSIFRHISPDCKKGACVKKCARFARIHHLKGKPSRPVRAQGHNTNKTLHSRCQSASRNGVIHSKFRKNKVKPDSSGIHNSHLGDGGDRRDRTDDLKLAKLPLYQLSYVPSLQSSHASGFVPRRILYGGPGKT